MSARRSLLFTVCALALVVACKRTDAAATPTAEGASATPARHVRFARVESRRAPRMLELAGTLAAEEQSAVATASAGVVAKVHVDVGDRVKKGDVLVTLDGRDAALRLAAARATEAQQRAALGVADGAHFDPNQTPDVRAARDSEQLAAKEAERARRLLDSGVITPSSADQAANQADQASAQLDRARNTARMTFASMHAAAAQARLSQKQLSDLRVLAPFDGAVAERRLSTGEFAQMGSVVAVVVDDDPLRLKLVVPETAVRGVFLGADVTLTAAAYPGEVFHGSVKRVGASLDVASRTLPLEAEVANADRRLRPGFFVRAYVSIPGTDTDVLTVPKAAVGSSGTSSRVFVREGERVTERLVTQGRTFGEQLEVTGTLKAGEEIAIEAVDQLGDGDAVAPAP